MLDAWIADPAASFQAAELDGEVAAVQRLRPVAPGIVHLEGLRVAAEHRRRGLARTLVRRALEDAGAQGFRELRLVTGNPVARRLFESEGFRLLTDCAVWEASRVEGGDLARLPRASEAPALAGRARADPAFAAYGGVNLDWGAVLDVDAALVERLAGQGLVRAGAGDRALALLQAEPAARLRVTFVSGAGAALQDLLTALRFEADGAALEGVRLLAPEDHPAAGDLEAVGYHLADDHPHLAAYARPLRNARLDR